MNIHTIHGRLTADPKLTRGETESKDRCNFTVAVDRRYGDETDFFDVTMFGKRAGVIEKFFSKGSEIAVTGEGQLRRYEDKVGNKRVAYGIVASDFDFCGSKRNDSTNSSSDTLEAAKSLLMPEDAPDSFDAAEDDIPF